MPDKTDEVLTTCQEKFKTDEPEQDDKKKWKEHACVADCFFKEKGALSENGTFINEKIVELAVACARGDEEWTGVMKTSAETCIKKCEVQ
jgi:hypothetical protein